VQWCCTEQLLTPKCTHTHARTKLHCGTRARSCWRPATHEHLRLASDPMRTTSAAPFMAQQTHAQTRRPTHTHTHTHNAHTHAQPHTTTARPHRPHPLATEASVVHPAPLAPAPPPRQLPQQVRPVRLPAARQQKPKGQRPGDVSAQHADRQQSVLVVRGTRGLRGVRGRAHATGDDRRRGRRGMGCRFRHGVEGEREACGSLQARRRARGRPMSRASQAGCVPGSPDELCHRLTLSSENMLLR
jgi:predicted component of type VI protein secretion system